MDCRLILEFLVIAGALAMGAHPRTAGDLWLYIRGRHGHIVYPLLPVIYEVAHENGIRPERPMAIAA